jgi:N-carbamoyl-L-amino-acid hydrolase
MSITLEQLNAAPLPEAQQLLHGLYEHSPWITDTALLQRPFTSLVQLKYVLTQVVDAAALEAQIALIRAHPELAGKAMVSNTLTVDSTDEQTKAGLTHCSPDELSHVARLNAAYGAKFGFPFVLAVRGARGVGLTKRDIFTTFERRLANHPDFELAECLRNIHRIVELRLNDKFGITPALGNDVWDWHEALSLHTDPGYGEKGQLTVTYLTNAHRACARQISEQMQECGFDEVTIDAVGNVVGRYHAHTAHDTTHAVSAKTLMTGSHYDTVRNGGKYDGRLGIYVPMACVRELKRMGKRLPFHLEVIGFAEEEGQRYRATFLGSGALIGDFKNEWLDQIDTDGMSMRDAMAHAGLNMADIPALKRNPADYVGFVEVHIEQGPVLNERHIPLGLVTSINGSVRYKCEVTGVACHAGTTPMNRRQDAAVAVAELTLYVEQRAGQDGDSVGTIGMLNVPNGSTNVVPGRCEFTLDLRAPSDAQRDALVADVLAELNAICARRSVSSTSEETMRAAAAPSDSLWANRWEKAVDPLGVPLFKMPSGAGHDAMKLHEVMPQAMLFVRGQNSGISHNPLESTTSDDMQLAVLAMMNLLNITAADLCH